MSPRQKHPARLYSYADIAAETGRSAAILRVWYQRGKLPPADYRVGQSPAWLPRTIAPWIEADRAAQRPAAP